MKQSDQQTNLILPPAIPKKKISGFKKIIVVDLGYWAGHRPNYFKTIIRLFSEEKKNIFIITSNRKAVEEFIHKENILNATILKLDYSLIEKIIFKSILILDQLVTFFKLTNWFKPESALQLLQIKALQKKNNLLDVPVFSTALIDLMAAVPMSIRPFLFPKKWSGIYVTPWYNTKAIFTKKDRWRRAYSDRSMTLPSCQGVFVIHPDYTRYYRRLLGKDHFFAIPEPISLEVNENFSLVKTIKEKSDNRFTITLLGGIGKKRNLLLLLDALTLLKNKDWFLVIIGRLQKADFSKRQLALIDYFFERYEDQCFIKLDGYITVEKDFNALIKASDLMYLHYHHHPFSSNQLLKAVALRKPVIVQRGGIVETITKQANWSAIVPYDSEAVALNIEKIQDQFTIDEVAYKNFMERLAYKNLRNTIINQLETINQPA